MKMTPARRKKSPSQKAQRRPVRLRATPIVMPNVMPVRKRVTERKVGTLPFVMVRAAEKMSPMRKLLLLPMACRSMTSDTMPTMEFCQRWLMFMNV